MLRRFAFVAGVVSLIFGSNSALLRATAAPLTEEAQSYSYHSGFPRTDPSGKIDFSSPTVADLNGDGYPEVLLGDGGGKVWAFDRYGNRLPGFPWYTGGARLSGPLALGNVDGDPGPEIVAGTRGTGNLPGQRGKVIVWNTDGSLVPGWPQEMAWELTGSDSEVMSVALGNLGGDAALEILAGTSNHLGALANPNLYAWNAVGGLLGSYPTWYRTAGIYGSIGAADLNGDGLTEVITGRDHLYLHAYDSNGNYLPGWPIQTYVDPARNVWGRDAYVEFTNNAPAMGDLDGDGQVEIVIAGKVRNGGHSEVGSALMVVEPTGTRRAGWQTARLHGGPLSGSFPPSQAPALADLDGDGRLEIVVAMLDGRLRAYRENGGLMWEYDFAQGRTLFASEPVIGDVTGDGRVDILFGTYSPQQNYNGDVGLIGLDANGNPLPGFPLALTRETGGYAGLRAAPTIADLDNDCMVEILAASWGSTLYVWDLSARYSPDRMPWPTGRHDNRRSGSAVGGAVADNPLASPEVPGARVYLPVISRCN